MSLRASMSKCFCVYRMCVVIKFAVECNLELQLITATRVCLSSKQTLNATMHQLVSEHLLFLNKEIDGSQLNRKVHYSVNISEEVINLIQVRLIIALETLSQ